MTDNEFLLVDRIQKIRSVINRYGKESFYISFSGGKDSTVLSKLVDLAFPGNQIPRVYANTGIEYNMVRDFVFTMAKTDKRVCVIEPTVPIKQMLEKDGYPFKSKEHSMYLDIFQRNGYTKTAVRYLYPDDKRKSFGCPEKLRYQFTNNFQLKCSKKCCDRLKKEPMKYWANEHNKKNVILGVMREEGGLRSDAKCIVPYHGGIHFQPLSVVTKKWEDWFIKEYQVEICEIYKPPYNFDRTGCKGCPYNINLQKDLDILKVFFPNEAKQCELIWQPVYEEYRRIRYRLKGSNIIDGQMNIFSYLNE